MSLGGTWKNSSWSSARRKKLAANAAGQSAGKLEACHASKDGAFMNKPLITVSDLETLVKRRKTLAVAAAVGVAGCSMFSPQVTDRQP